MAARKPTITHKDITEVYFEEKKNIKKKEANFER